MVSIKEGGYDGGHDYDEGHDYDSGGGHYDGGHYDGGGGYDLKHSYDGGGGDYGDYGDGGGGHYGDYGDGGGGGGGSNSLTTSQPFPLGGVSLQDLWRYDRDGDGLITMEELQMGPMNSLSQPTNPIANTDAPPPKLSFAM
jgi:hypothetical protein